MICNLPIVDLVNMNAYIKFGEILSICSQDIEQKQKHDGMTGQPKSNLASNFSKRGNNKYFNP